MQKNDPSQPVGVLALADAIQDMGALAFLTMHKYKLPIKEIKTAKELDLSNKELRFMDAIFIAALIKVCRLHCSQKEIKL